MKGTLSFAILNVCHYPHIKNSTTAQRIPITFRIGQLHKYDWKEVATTYRKQALDIQNNYKTDLDIWHRNLGLCQ